MEALEEGTEAWQKAKEQAEAAEAFAQFRRQGEHGLQTLLDQLRKASLIKLGSRQVYGYLSPGEDYQILILVPLRSLLGATAQVWLLPFLVLELILVYGLSRIRMEHARAAAGLRRIGSDPEAAGNRLESGAESGGDRRFNRHDEF